MTIAQGHIWTVVLDPAVANEPGGTRPSVVVSTDRFNALPIRQSIIVPLTTRERGLPHHVPIVDDGGLNRSSWAMCEAVRTVSTQRFDRFIGTASQTTTDAIIRQVTIWLSHRA